MSKSYKKWHKIKVLLSGKESTAVFKEGDVWWCSLGLNLGDESYGKGSNFRRPVLVYKKFTSSTFLGLPLTSQEKHGSWYVNILIHEKSNWLMLNQVRILDKKRISNKIITLSSDDFNRIKSKFLEFYGCRNSHPANS